MRLDSVDEERRRAFLKMMAGGSLAGVMSIAGCGGAGDGSDGGTTDGSDGDAETDTPQRQRIPVIDYAVLPENTHNWIFEGARLQVNAFAELGVEMNFHSEEVGTMIDLWLEQAYEDTLTMSFGSAPIRLDPEFFLSFWEEKDSRENHANWVNDEYQELMDEQRRTYDRDERQDIVYRLQEIWVEEQPVPFPTFRPWLNTPYNNERVSIPEPVPPGDGNESFWTRTYPDVAEGVETLRYGDVDPIDTLNALDPQPGIGLRYSNGLYDRLFRVNREGVAEPWMVDDFEQESDTAINMTLRDDLEFHDGEPVTTEDIKFSYELHANNGGRWSVWTDFFDSIETQSDLDIRFVMEEPNAASYVTTFAYVPIIPEHIWADVDNPLEFTGDHIGSGPWQFNYWRREEELSFVAHENHFEPPTFQEHLYIPHASSSGMIRSLEAGELDLYMGQPPSLEQQSRIEDEIGHVSMKASKDFGTAFVFLDTTEAPFDDLAFRRALAHANPIDDMIDVLFDGQGTPSTSPITAANPFWHNDNIDYPGDDIEKARQILEDAGYSWDDDGRLLYPAES